MGVVETIALAMGVGWASGINLYATVCTLGILSATGNIILPPELQILGDPLVIVAAGVMYVIEFFADKVPAVDSGWDVIHTFIRIPAGAVLAAGAVGDVSPGAELAAAIAGGTLAAGSHVSKAGSRAMINVSPEPFTNWMASFGEDVAVIGGLFIALHHPIVFLVLLALFIVVMIWLLPRISRGLQRIGATLGRWLGRGDADDSSGEVGG